MQDHITPSDSGLNPCRLHARMRAHLCMHLKTSNMQAYGCILCTDSSRQDAGNAHDRLHAMCQA